MKLTQRIAALVMALMLVLSSTAAFADTSPASQRQVVTSGGTVYYNANGQKVENANKLGDNGSVVEMTKTVAGTENENEFEVTLQVKTKQDLRELVTLTPDAAVMLVMDVSNSMDDCVHCGKEKGDDCHKPETETHYYCPGTTTKYEFNIDTWSCKHCGKSFSQHVRKEVITKPAACTYRSRLEDAQTAAKQFIQQFANQTGATGNDKRMVAIVSFGSDAKRELNWVDVRTADGYNQAINAIGSHSNGTGLKISGGTNIEGGLMLAKNNLQDGLKTGKALAGITNLYTILLTDGNPTFYVSRSNESSSTTSITGTQGGGNSTTFDDVADVGDEASAIRSLTAQSRLYSICFGTGVFDSKLTGSTWSTANPPVTANETVGKWLGDFSNAAYDGGSDVSGLFDSFGTIISLINVGAKAWLVEDSMGIDIANTGYVPVKNKAGNGSLNNFTEVDKTTGKIKWYLLKSDMDDNITKLTNDGKGNFTGVVGYTYKYKVKLDNLATGHTAETKYNTNGAATLKYMVADEKGNWPTEEKDFKTGEFPNPSVKSLAGNLTFTKVNDTGKALPGVGFTLSLTGENGKTWTQTASSANDGTVSFTNIPSGHSYVLSENGNPVIDGIQYAAHNPIDVKVSYGAVTADNETVNSDHPLSVVNVAKKAEIVVSKVFAGLPEDVRPDSITVTATKKGTQNSNSIILSASNNWQGTIGLNEAGTYVISEDIALGSTVGDYILTEIKYSASEIEVDLDQNKSKSVTVTNIYEKNVGTLTLTKEFSGLPDGTTLPDVSFTVTPEGATEPYAVVYLKAKDGETRTNVMTKTNGTYSITLNDVPVGNYTVKEVANTANVDGYSLTVSGGGLVTVEKKGTPSTTIKNDYTRQKGNLQITKSFDFGEGVTETKRPTEISITVTGPDTNKTHTLNQANNWSITLNNLPTGNYTITEDTTTAAIDGYTLSNSNLPLTVYVGTSSVDTAYVTARITNTYTRDTNDLTITKTFTGATVNPDMSFEISDPNNSTTTVYLKNDTDGTRTNVMSYDKNSETYFFTLEGVPTGTYTVKEVGAAVDGYTHNMSVTVDGTSATPDENGKVTAAVTKKDTATVVAFTNTYTQKTGTITVTKSFEGLPNETRPTSVTVNILNANNTTVDILTLNAGNNWKATSNALPYGTYHFTETDADVDGYTLDPAFNPTSVSLSDSSTAATVALTNTYTRNTGSLKITKTFSGLPTETTRPSLTFTVKDSQGTIYQTVKLPTDNGQWETTLTNVPTGTYTVTESDATVAGYSYSTTVKVNQGTDVSGTSASVSISKDTESTVAFTNAYSLTDAVVISIPVSKTVTASGNVKPTGEHTFNFVATIAKASAPATQFSFFGLRNAGSTLTPVAPGTYTVKFGGTELTLGESGYPFSLTVDGAPKDPTSKTLTIAVNEADFPLVITIKETAGTETDWTYDTTTHTITVNRDANGQLTYTGGSGNANNEAAFTNTYTHNVGALTITKEFTLNGATLPDVSFTVSGPNNYSTIVYLKAGETRDHVMTETDGKYSITLSALPLGTYTVTENNADVDGYSCEVKVNGNVANKAEVTFGTAADQTLTSTITFTNTYTQKTGTITVTKSFEGLPNETRPASVTVKILNANNTTVDTLTLNAGNNWKATSNALPYGTYHFEENNANVDGYTLVPAFDPTSVTINDDTPATGASVSLTNKYTPTEALEISIPVSKIVELGGNVAPTDKHTFNFVATIAKESSNDDAIATNRSARVAVAPGNYTVKFGGKELTLGESGYSFSLTVDGAGSANNTLTIAANEADFPLVITIAETAGTETGWTYDETVHKITVVNKDGQLTYMQESGSSSEFKPWEGPATFTNTYTDFGVVTLNIPVSKIVARGENGNTDPNGSNTFRFVLAPIEREDIDSDAFGKLEVAFDGKPLTAKDGQYTFELSVNGCGESEGKLSITGDYDVLNSFPFTISEVAPTKPSGKSDEIWTYDASIYMIYPRIDVVQKDGKFIAFIVEYGVERANESESDSDDQMYNSAVEFKNLYTKLVTDLPKTGDQSNLALWLALMVLGTVGFVVVMKRRRTE